MVISHLLSGMILQVPGTTQLASGICKDGWDFRSPKNAVLVGYQPAPCSKGVKMGEVFFF